jgi:signal transduction histidine kinase
MKYANCTSVIINIGRDQISIIDDGNGFEIDSVKKGYGLQNIEVRVQEMNANLKIVSSGGTSITVTL